MQSFLIAGVFGDLLWRDPAGNDVLRRVDPTPYGSTWAGIGAPNCSPDHTNRTTATIPIPPAPVSPLQRSRAAALHRALDAVGPGEFEAVVERAVVADEQHLAQGAAHREAAAVDVGIVALDDLVAVEPRQDRERRVEAERGAVFAVDLRQPQQRRDRAAEFDRARRVEVLPGVAERTAAEADAAVGAVHGLGEQDLQAVAVRVVEHGRQAVGMRRCAQQRGEVAGCIGGRPGRPLRAASQGDENENSDHPGISGDGDAECNSAPASAGRASGPAPGAKPRSPCHTPRGLPFTRSLGPRALRARVLLPDIENPR